ncbi:MAG: CPBP family intramembrane glutamic endopeptidase, partial [Halobacteria archaeon]
MKIKFRKTLLFITLTFLFSYLLAALYYLSSGRVAGIDGLVLAISYMFIPMTTTIIIQKFIYRESLKELGISFKLNKWFLAAWLLPLLIAFQTFAISLLFPGIQYTPNMEGIIERYQSTLTQEQIEQIKNQIAASPVHPIYIAIIQGLIAGITINAVTGFGEELGWRGFLLKQLEDMGLWRASLVIGIAWGFWHAPLIIQGYNYPEHPLPGVFMMAIFTLLLSPIFSYIRIKAKSVIAAAIMHGSLNGTYGISIR